MIIIKGEKGKSTLVSDLIKNKKSMVVVIGDPIYFEGLNAEVYFYNDYKEIKLSVLISDILDEIKEKFEYVIIYTNLPEMEINKNMKEFKRLENDSNIINLIITCKRNKRRKR